ARRADAAGEHRFELARRRDAPGDGPRQVERLVDHVVVGERLEAGRGRREELGDELAHGGVEVAAGAALRGIDEEKAAEGEVAARVLELARGGRRELLVAREVKERRLEELLLREPDADRVVARPLDRGADGDLGAKALEPRRARRAVRTR